MRKSWIILALIAGFAAKGQISAGPDLSLCYPAQLELVASLSQTTSQAIFLSDDQFSGVIPIGFSFDYYGNTYTQLVISSNNYVTFDLSNAGGASGWQILGAAPGAGNTPNNSILAPFQDVNPSALTSGPIFYGVSGTAPNRIFSVTFCELPMFSCTNLMFSSQLRLYESSNKIEMHIQSKPVCSSWNGGYAIQGLIDATGSANSVIVTGRNFPNVWTATSEGWEFIPNGTGSYNYNPITFAPVIVSNPSSPNIIEWVDANGSVLTLGDTLVTQPFSSTYFIARTLICGGQQYVQDTVNVTIAPLIFTNLVSAVTCNGGTDGSVLLDTLSASGVPPYSILWDNGATAAQLTGLTSGMYTVTVTDAIGCQFVDSFLVDQPDYLDLDASIALSDTCDASLGTIQPDYIGGVTPLSYSWNTGSSASSLSGLNSGTYWVSVTDQNGCARVDTFVIDNYDANVVFDTSLVIPDYCESASGEVYLNTSGGSAPYDFIWSNGATDSVVLGLTEGMYYVTLTDKNGCSYEDSVYVPSYPAAIADFTVSSDTVYTSFPVIQFMNATPNGAQWQWNFGDGTTGSGDTLLHTYNDVGVYNVTMQVVDSNGCVDITFRTVYVVEEFYFYVPNAFTPNLDGLNDYFSPSLKGIDFTTYRMEIYGRNGQLIFETENYLIPWNGFHMNTGEAIPGGAYTYRITFRTYSDRAFEELGVVQLVR